MTSTKERQRAAARARLAREMAERAAAARRRRRIQIAVGSAASLLLLAVGTVWIVTSLGDDEEAGGGSEATSALCVWHEVPEDQRSETIKDVGFPPNDVPNSGTQVISINTNFGPVEVTMDLSKVPCTAANFRHLASKNFWDGTKCHRMFPGMLQCGDPSAKGEGYRETDGTGGPAYRFANENLPFDELPPYPAGIMAMANSGGQDTNGSQFFFVYEDVNLTPDYTVVGRITSGLENIKKATEAGHDGAFEPQPGGGHPKNDIEITTIRVSEIN